MHGQWLWSFNQTQQCLSIQHLNLYNISLGEITGVRAGCLMQNTLSSHCFAFEASVFRARSSNTMRFLLQVAVSVDGLPSLKQGEAYSCFFQDTETPALPISSGVICSTPDASSLPPIAPGDGERPSGQSFHGEGHGVHDSFLSYQQISADVTLRWYFGWSVCGVFDSMGTVSHVKANPINAIGQYLCGAQTESRSHYPKLKCSLVSEDFLCLWTQMCFYR